MASLISRQFLRFVASQPVSVRMQIQEIIESTVLDQSQKFQVLYYLVKKKRYLPVSSLDVLTLIANIEK